MACCSTTTRPSVATRPATNTVLGAVHTPSRQSPSTAVLAHQLPVVATCTRWPPPHMRPTVHARAVPIPTYASVQTYTTDTLAAVLLYRAAPLVLRPRNRMLSVTHTSGR